MSPQFGSRLDLSYDYDYKHSSESDKRYRKVFFMDSFVFIPISIYLVFTGLFVQQGLMNLFIHKDPLIPKRRFFIPFIFTSTLFCLSLLLVLTGPVFGFTANQLRWSFFVVWLVAPAVGYLYTLTLAEHLDIERHRVNWITRFSVAQFIVTLGMGVYTFITDVPILFSYEKSSFQSRIDIHIGGVFSPNTITFLMVILTTAVVISAATFFVREMFKTQHRDISLMFGVSLTAFAIIVEQVGYLFQWSLIFSLMPVANSIEVIRLTYLQTIAAGRNAEQANLQVRRDKLQIKEHLTALAHDLNTPLTSLKLSAGKLKEGHIEDEAHKQFTKELEYIHIVCANLLTLFQLELSSIDSSQRSIHLDAPISGVIPRFERLADESGVTVTLNPIRNLKPIACDPILLEQTIGNLIYNAITHAKASVSVNVTQDQEQTCIEIVDDGTPIPSFTMPSLSDRSYRSFLETKIGCPGWGLGIVIADTFAKLHHGSLKITTRTDGQTAVRLHITSRA